VLGNTCWGFQPLAGARLCRSDNDCDLGKHEACSSAGSERSCEPTCYSSCVDDRGCAPSDSCTEFPCCASVPGMSSSMRRCIGPSATPAFFPTQVDSGVPPADAGTPPSCEKSGCPDGQRCRNDGVCESIPCTEGWTCGPGLRCLRANEGVLWRDVHFCVPLLCNEGWACPPDWICDVRFRGTIAGVPLTDFHACRQQHCGEGAPCVAGTACVKNLALSGEFFSCRSPSCNQDSDCTCGTCLLNTCYPGPASCQVQLHPRGPDASAP
jgi:hypothetical protein